LALQGTLDTFALPDVLQLLAATKKTGCLRLDGPRGSGTVHVDGGELVAVAAAHAPLATEVPDALFELLRFDEGAFVFDPDVAPDARGDVVGVDAALDAASALLAEWREIESVVPSWDAYVTLRRELDGDEVTIAAEHWGTLVAIAGGTTVRGLGEALTLAELPVSRAVRDLLALGVVDLEERAPEPAAPAAVPEPTPQPAPEADAADTEAIQPPPAPAPAEGATEVQVPTDEPAPGPEVRGGGEAPDDGLPVARPIKARRPRPRVLEASSGPDVFVPLDLPGHHRSPGSGYDDDGGLTAAFPGLSSRSALSEDEDAAVSEQLAALSPEVADAVLAAAEAATEEERAAALDQAVGEEGAPINRGLLLKFLGSAKS
jgi:outer membrane biosynthesis protein TonB